MPLTKTKRLIMISTVSIIVFAYGLANYQIWITKEAGNDYARSIDGMIVLAAILLIIPAIAVIPIFLHWTTPKKEELLK